MTEATCRRELELEIPVEDVKKTIDKVAKDLARVARVPGFRPGKAPVPLIRRRYADDIKTEVLQSLVPEQIEKAVKDKNLMPVTQPQVEQVDYAEDKPLKFKAVFEVLPEFELGEYKDLEVEVESAAVTDADVEKQFTGAQERGATYVPVEGRAAQNGDYVQIKLAGEPVGGGEPLKSDDVMCHIGAEDTLEVFSENLRGVQAGEQRAFEVKYPADYPDPKLAGKDYNYTVEVLAIKEKKLPELNDEFVQSISDSKTVDELRTKVREGLEAERDERQKAAVRDALLSKLTAAHDFPVPEAMVEGQMDTRLERAVRSLASQGVDPRAVNVDWVAMRQRQRDRAVSDVKAELLLDRIATAENIEPTEEEVEAELAHIGEHRGESAAQVRATLTKQGALDRMKSKLRSDKTLDWLQRNSRIKTREATGSS
jgi:trigger factor